MASISVLSVDDTLYYIDDGLEFLANKSKSSMNDLEKKELTTYCSWFLKDLIDASKKIENKEFLTEKLISVVWFMNPQFHEKGNELVKEDIPYYFPQVSSIFFCIEG